MEKFSLSNVTGKHPVDLQRRKVKNTQDLVASQTFKLTVHLSFPMIHKVGNVVIFVLLWSKGIEPATLRPQYKFTVPCLSNCLEVSIERNFTSLVLVQQTLWTFWIKLKSIEHYYIRISEVSILQETEISTVRWAWDCTRFNYHFRQNFADIDLPFAIKQYKNDNIANFKFC